MDGLCSSFRLTSLAAGDNTLLSSLNELDKGFDFPLFIDAGNRKVSLRCFNPPVALFPGFFTCTVVRIEMMYEYEYLHDLFNLSTSETDVSSGFTIALHHLTRQVEGPFGLRPPPGDWATFRNRINGNFPQPSPKISADLPGAELKKRCASGETIKVIYAARHGQAEHNGLSEKYGEPNETV